MNDPLEPMNKMNRLGVKGIETLPLLLPRVESSKTPLLHSTTCAYHGPSTGCESHEIENDGSDNDQGKMFSPLT